MRAIDTNIVIRIITRDDPAQADRAREAVEAGDVFLSSTVVLEAFWVLTSNFGFDPAKTADALQSFVSLETVVLEDPARVMIALDRAAQGFDFADALHLGAAVECESFLTFDRKLISRSKDLAGPPVREP